MRTRTIVSVAAFCMIAVAAFAADPNVGSWKLNDAKSKFPAGAAKNQTVVYTADGDSYKCVVDGVDGSGKPAHNEWTGKFDGKDYPVTGEANADMRSVKKNGMSYMINNKKDGKSTVSGTVTFSKDKKTRTLKLMGHDAAGKAWNGTYVYDRQ